MQLQQKGMWLPLLASVGIGTAAYISMTKGGRSMTQMAQQMVPFVSSMGCSQNQQQTQQQGQQQGTQTVDSDRYPMSVQQ